METVIEHLALSLLSTIPEPPKFAAFKQLTFDQMKEESTVADNYADDVRRLLNDTQWGMDVRSIIAGAPGAGEEALREIPHSERPPDIDPLDLRRYMIAKTLCQRLWIFVRVQRIEGRDKYRNYLSFLKQRSQDRRTANSN